MLDIYKRGNITVNDQWELPIKLGIDWRYSGLKYLTVGITYLDINRYTYIYIYQKLFILQPHQPHKISFFDPKYFGLTTDEGYIFKFNPTIYPALGQNRIVTYLIPVSLLNHYKL